MIGLLFALCSVSEAKDSDWKIRPHLDPIGSMTVFDDGSNRKYGFKYGGSAGIRYQQKKRGLRMQGLTRAQYTRTWAPVVAGEELRVGSFIGPWWRVVGVQGGVDYIVTDRYSNPHVDIPTANAIAPSLEAVADIRIVRLSIKAGPSYFVANPRQSVDWSQTDFPGFGDEFSYSAQANVGLGIIGVGANISKRYTAYGEEFITGVGLTFF